MFFPLCYNVSNEQWSSSFCRLTFETSLKLRGGPSIVFAHSLGNNVFRYFLEWLRLEIAPKHYMEWLDQHIHAYFAIGSQFFTFPMYFPLKLNVFFPKWIEIDSCLAVDIGAPLLGSVEIVKTTLSGITFGLPVSKVTFDFFSVTSN